MLGLTEDIACRKQNKRKTHLGFSLADLLYAQSEDGHTRREEESLSLVTFFFFLLRFVKSAMKSAAETQTVVDSLDDSLHCLGFVKVNVLLENSPLCKK